MVVAVAVVFRAFRHPKTINSLNSASRAAQSFSAEAAAAAAASHAGISLSLAETPHFVCQFCDLMRGQLDN